jgi:hypothetical protein
MAISKISQERHLDVENRVHDLIAAELDRPEASRTSGTRTLKLAIELLGSHVVICDAPAYFEVFGRSQGYYLPSYPLDGRGEIRDLLADWGVRDLLGWYGRIGIDREHYLHLHEYRLVAAMNRAYRHRAFLIAPTWQEMDGVAARHLALLLLEFCNGAERSDDPDGAAHPSKPRPEERAAGTDPYHPDRSYEGLYRGTTLY